MINIKEDQQVWSIGFLIRKQLAQHLHKLVIKKILKRKVYERFKDYTWTVDLAEMR